MEEVLLRFPHLGDQIFENLDNENLAQSRTISRSWLAFINEEKISWKKIQKKFPCKKGETNLHLAAKTNQTEMFQILFEGIHTSIDLVDKVVCICFCFDANDTDKTRKMLYQVIFMIEDDNYV